MFYDSFRHHRRSIRLQGYDYSSEGAYFVTICVKDRENLFGGIAAGELWLNKFGGAVVNSWQWLEERYSYVRLDEWVLMPNHLHGIIVIDPPCRGDSRIAPTTPIVRKHLGRLIGAFKTISTKEINQMRGTTEQPIWQRNYYERIIRNEAELNRIRQYIYDNPANWESDPDNVHVGVVRERPLC